MTNLERFFNAVKTVAELGGDEAQDAIEQELRAFPAERAGRAAETKAEVTS